jgi:hypothetical protein
MVHALGYGLDNRRIGFQLQTKATDISLIQSVQTARSAFPAAYSIGYCSGIKRPRSGAEHPYLQC